ncbi:hypothetical protein EZV62_026377 [Acer yangbiense]|uniref:Tryptophan synthase beta chain-like PALP domain-containing protein n=1 Tax=Acer yangbiense TaxID=1000413 RepID=A0A5C7GR65_9ROSI|nr:hypothetical protein EZV62_026377 [Acer yangbiense]
MSCNYIQTFFPNHRLKVCPLLPTKKVVCGLVTHNTAATTTDSSTCSKTSLIMRKPLTKSLVEIDQTDNKLNKVVNPGKFGKFGGKFVPETLVACLNQLEVEFNFLLQDSEFQDELSTALRDYVGRETPLYFAKRLTDYYKNDNGEGPEIYLKREDLNHVGAHKINNAIAQAMIAKRMGRKIVVAATGAG